MNLTPQQRADTQTAIARIIAIDIAFGSSSPMETAGRILAHLDEQSRSDDMHDPAADWDEDAGYEYDDTQVDLNVEPVEDEGFYGVGLVVREDGTLAIVVTDHDEDDQMYAYPVSSTEAGALAAMIDAVLG